MIKRTGIERIVQDKTFRDLKKGSQRSPLVCGLHPAFAKATADMRGGGGDDLIACPTKLYAKSGRLGRITKRIKYNY